MSMPTAESRNAYWSSQRIFILVAAGAVISLGNVWRLPFLMGNYGGSAFLLVYILCCATIVLPVLVAELLIGRKMRANMIDGTRELARAADAHRLWLVIGVSSVAGAVLVLSFYSVIAGWSMAYVFRAASGALEVFDLPQAESIFLSVAGDPERSLAWHTLFIVATTICAAHGLSGIEKISRAMVPAAFLFVIIMLVMVFVSGSPGRAWHFLFSPDWQALGWRGIFEALRQAYFSLSLGVGVMVAYGVYLRDEHSVLAGGIAVISLDLLFAILSGLAVYALVFAAGQVPSASTSLVFEMLPLAVASSDQSGLALVLLYTALVIITLTSAVALMEPVVVWVKERFGVSRVFATTAAALVIWFLGLGSLLSFNVIDDLRFLDRNFFEWVTMITAHILLPIVGLLVCVFVSRLMPATMLREAWGSEPGKAFDIWLWCLRYPARVGLILVVLYTMGLFDWMVNFWNIPPASAVSDVVTVIEGNNGGR